MSCLLAGQGMAAEDVPSATAFRGWQKLAVIPVEGTAGRLRQADLDGDGREELLLVNTPKSRVEIFHWLPADQRQENPALDPDNPNALPMTPEFEREELALDELPQDVLAHDLDGDGRQELIVLVAPPAKVHLFRHEGQEAGWQRWRSYELLEGPLDDLPQVILLRAGAGAEAAAQLLISCAAGIQVLDLAEDAKPRWHSPKEAARRSAWWLLDLDGDGDEDLVEWTARRGASVRWHQNADGRLLPAEPVRGEDVVRAEALRRREGADEILLQEANQRNVVKRFRMERGEASAAGERQLLPLPQGQAAWIGLTLDGQPAVAFPDPAQPRLYVHRLEEKGFTDEQTFPIVGNVQALAAPQARPGTLLLWTKNATDLHLSEWQDGRLSYPRPMPQSPEVEDRRILALDAVGTTTWWAQKVGEDLYLYTWPAEAEEPRAALFKGAGGKADKVAWLGGRRLLVLEQYARSPKLLAADEDGTVRSSSPGHLQAARMEEFLLFPIGGELRLGRLTDGVLQWLGDDLHPTDQIMLPEGKRLSHYVPLAGGEAWALELGGGRMHLLRPDEAGVARVVESVKLPGGLALRQDPVLGLVLQGEGHLATLRPGQPWELVLVDSVDERAGRPEGIKEAAIDRLFTVDVLGAPDDEMLLVDDGRHQLTLLEVDEHKLEPVLSWPVFEDSSYPYGGEDYSTYQQVRAEPRLVLSLDLDGDDLRDLAMICHDRLLIYLARDLDEVPPSQEEAP